MRRHNAYKEGKGYAKLMIFSRVPVAYQKSMKGEVGLASAQTWTAAGTDPGLKNRWANSARGLPIGLRKSAGKRRIDSSRRGRNRHPTCNWEIVSPKTDFLIPDPIAWTNPIQQSAAFSVRSNAMSEDSTTEKSDEFLWFEANDNIHKKKPKKKKKDSTWRFWIGSSLLLNKALQRHLDNIGEGSASLNVTR